MSTESKDYTAKKTHFDLFVRHTVTNSSIKLIQRFPSLLLKRQERACLLRALQSRCPDLKSAVSIT